MSIVLFEQVSATHKARLHYGCLHLRDSSQSEAQIECHTALKKTRLTLCLRVSKFAKVNPVTRR